MARLGAATIGGVPALGFPKIRSRVGLIVRPAFAASPPKSILANVVRPRVAKADSNLDTVSANEWALARLSIPLLLDTDKETCRFLRCPLIILSFHFDTVWIGNVELAGLREDASTTPYPFFEVRPLPAMIPLASPFT